MTVDIKDEGTRVVVRLSGRLDTAASVEMAPQFQKVNELASKVINLDCSELSYISSSGLRLFLTLRKKSIEAGGEVTVSHINEDIRNVFLMTGFLNLFTIQ